jgi:hypothetical protein
MPEKTWSLPLTSAEAVLKGFIAGFLVGAGVFNPFGTAVQLVLVVLGALVFLDAAIPSGRAVHGFTVIVLAMTGGLVVFVLSMTGNAFIFVVIAVIIAVLIYVKRVLTGLHILGK